MPAPSLFPHRAIEVAVRLWDDCDPQTGRLRDLKPFEQKFLTAVHQIGNDACRTMGEANRSFGTDSKAALAVEFTARQRRDERYQAALETYEREVEAQDECLDVEAEQQREVA